MLIWSSPEGFSKLQKLHFSCRSAKYNIFFGFHDTEVYKTQNKFQFIPVLFYDPCIEKFAE